ncbi:MAG: hypothetical protein WAW85_15075 [Gordonia sp. (in: high G+C Gram-positive bacteria)]|uniref:hypothetical protein n=1 Tax=Gordonia sp. (in: high G+C Gram-positive bacteria) TaxID=84139 RepID=UPI003BB5CE65
MVLLDDHGWAAETLTSADDVAQAADLLEPLRAAAVEVLSRTEAGSTVTVRLLPHGRNLFGTVAVDGRSGQSRLDFGADGAQMAGRSKN